MNPDALLELLKSKANARKQHSLDIIYSVCKDQVERGSRDFSIATIGKISREQGGPSPQTIRNKGGLDFRALIKTWAEHSNGSTKKPPKIQDAGLYSILEKIDDPAVRSVVGTILATNRKLQGEVNLLKQQSEIVIDRRTVPLQNTTCENSPTASLTSSEIAALKHAISPDFLKQEGWAVESNGRISNKQGRTIFKAGFATAIRKTSSE